MTVGLRLGSNRKLALLAILLLTPLLSGCGQDFLLLKPAGPVARTEMHLMERAAIPMGIVILFVIVLLAIVVIRFRDTPDNKAPYTPDWHGSKRLETIWFVIPVLILAFISVPMVKQTFKLAKVPVTSGDPITIDVVSIDWKWLFEYPGQKVATVNYVKIPVNTPVLFELTAYSPMNTFWVPQLGGMEYTMPGRVLPLWLQASYAGVYTGRSANFSGSGYAKMIFSVDAVSSSQFQSWISQVASTASPLTGPEYQSLLQQDLVQTQTYYGYPSYTFPSQLNGFTLNGGMYIASPLPSKKSTSA